MSRPLGRPLAPHGTVAAARRHERAGEAKCDACAKAWSEHQHAMYAQRKGGDVSRRNTTTAKRRTK